MMRFVVFDVETPNRRNDRMSAIGITIVDKGAIAEEFYSLINPETHFDDFNVQLTGIDETRVSDAPTFPEVWPQIAPLMESGILVAHNAVFDMGVLKKCLAHYGIHWQKKADYLCTVSVGRKLLPRMSHKLNMLCDFYGIELDHHQADSDSRACAQILLRYMESGFDIDGSIKQYFFDVKK